MVCVAQFLKGLKGFCRRQEVSPVDALDDIAILEPDLCENTVRTDGKYLPTLIPAAAELWNDSDLCHKPVHIGQG